MRTPLGVGVVVLGLTGCLIGSESVTPQLSTFSTLPRLPPRGEWLSLTLKGQKIGYTRATLGPGLWDGVEVDLGTEEIVMATQTARMSTLFEKAYAPAPPGKLLGFRMVQLRDDQRDSWVGTCTDKALVVLHHRAAAPEERLELPPCRETVSAAYLAHLSAKSRSLEVSRMMETATHEKGTNAMFLNEVVLQTPQGPVPTARVKWDEAIHFIARDGRTLRVEYGGLLVGEATTEAEAWRIGGLDMAAMVQLRLVRPFPARAQTVPATVVVLISNLDPAQVLRVPNRQEVEVLPDGRQRVTINSHRPVPTEHLDPRGERAAASGPTDGYDSTHPRIVALVKQVAGEEKDPWVVAQRLAAALESVEVVQGFEGNRASEVLAAGKGSRPDVVGLFITLARASGIPARRVAGLLAIGAVMYPATWAEIFVSGEWLSVDPTVAGLLAPPDRIALREERVWTSALMHGDLRVEVVEP